jgi:hypothetical protein
VFLPCVALGAVSLSYWVRLGYPKIVEEDDAQVPRRPQRRVGVILMLRHKRTEENENGEEQRENRLRNPSPPFAIAEIPVAKTQVPAPTTLAERVAPKMTERVSTKKQGNSKTTMREKQRTKRGRLWRELVSENPMYHKELLAGRRNVEMRTPWRRFLAKAMPIGILGSIYASIYYALSWVYSNAYAAFIAATNNTGHSAYYETTLPNASPIKYALEESIAVSAVAYTVIMALLFLVIGIGIPFIATMRITSEREKMNWNALIMSRLTPAQILIGKAALVLRVIGMIYLAALPALIITALLVLFPVISIQEKYPPSPNAYSPTALDVGVYLLRTALLPHLVILVTAALNTMIATYYSLVKKRGGEASVGAMRGTLLPIFGPLGLSGLLYAVPNCILFFQNKMQASNVNFADWAYPLLLSPNIFSPIGALLASFYPQVSLINPGTGQYAFSDSLWFYLIGFAPFIYIATALGLMRQIWKQMLKIFEHTPKDASG